MRLGKNSIPGEKEVDLSIVKRIVSRTVNA